MKTIKEMPKQDRPREKMHAKGASALTDEELVQVILGHGLQGADVRAMSRDIARLIREKKRDLAESDLTQVKGVGPARADQILAAFELARRHLLRDTVKIMSTQDAIPLLTDIADRKQEHFVCISLNGASEVIEKRIVTIGLLDRSQVHPREVFADVIADRAAAVVLAHNHPSGDIRPSDNDLRIHRQLYDAAGILGIRVQDHIIIGKGGHYSFAESGLL